MSKITMTYNKTEYVLEYNRQSVKTLEGQGFRLDEIANMPMTMIPMLFHGAFYKNHKGIKRSLIDEIYEGIGDKTGLIQALAEMYAETLSTLTDDAGEGNVTWALLK
jgi:hypothetical protein